MKEISRSLNFYVTFLFNSSNGKYGELSVVLAVHISLFVAVERNPAINVTLTVQPLYCSFQIKYYILKVYSKVLQKKRFNTVW